MQKSPGLKHFQQLKRYVKFIKFTASYGIEFVWQASDPVSASLTLQGWADSSLMDDVDTSCSTIAYVTTINGTVLNAKSKRGKSVDLSINAAEMRAFGNLLNSEEPETEQTSSAHIKGICNATRDLKYLRQLLAFFLDKPVAELPPISVFVDNAGVLTVLKHQFNHDANKHVYAEMNYIREQVMNMSIKPTKVASEDNIADSGTKLVAGDAGIQARLKLAYPIAPTKEVFFFQLCNRRKITIATSITSTPAGIHNSFLRISEKQLRRHSKKLSR